MGAQSGEKRSRKIGHPIMPSGSEVAELMKPTSRLGTGVGTVFQGRGTEMPHQRITGEKEMLRFTSISLSLEMRATQARRRQCSWHTSGCRG